MKFINLLKKELSELINLQMILGLVVSLAIFMVLGTVMKTSINEAVDESTNVTINISDRDKTDFTNSIIEALNAINSDPDENTNVKIKIFETEGDDYADILSSNDISNLIVIPKGFTDSINKTEQPELISISRMTSFALQPGCKCPVKFTLMICGIFKRIGTPVMAVATSIPPTPIHSMPMEPP